ncbi:MULTISPECIES: hypothetical protein [Nocardia]|uniref:hypothetical protein n=1 Tax=Nocardia TaxID=1817 RepID=UPI0013008353|nr:MULTISPECIES: hypothetical protein [Nocardia]
MADSFDIRDHYRAEAAWSQYQRTTAIQPEALADAHLAWLAGWVAKGKEKGQ